MDFIKVCFGILFMIVWIVLIREEYKGYGLIFKIAVCTFLALYFIGQGYGMLSKYRDFLSQISPNIPYLSFFLKALGICYLCSFVSELAKEEGFGQIGSQVELMGKLSVFFMSAPVIATILETLNRLF